MSNNSTESWRNVPNSVPPSVDGREDGSNGLFHLEQSDLIELLQSISEEDPSATLDQIEGTTCMSIERKLNFVFFQSSFKSSEQKYRNGRFVIGDFGSENDDETEWAVVSASNTVSYLVKKFGSRLLAIDKVTTTRSLTVLNFEAAAEKEKKVRVLLRKVAP